MNAPGVLLFATIAICIAIQFWLFAREAIFQTSRLDTNVDQKTYKEDREKQRTTRTYAIARIRLAAFSAVLDVCLFIWATLGGGLKLINAYWQTIFESQIYTGIFVILTIVLIQAGVRWILTSYKEFVVERRYGTGRLKFPRFVKDTLINTGMIVVIGGVLAFACVFGAETFELQKWIFVWLVWTCFDWGRSWLYPSIRSVMFEKYSEIDNPVMETRIKKLMEQSGCRVDKIQVIESSARSSHANANVVGIGNTKRVVLLDTLLKTLTPDETLAVVAHELGHAHHSHVVKMQTIKSAIAFLWIVGMGHLLDSSSIQIALNVQVATDGMLFALLWLLTPLMMVLARPLISMCLRAFEFQADRFAFHHDSAEALVSALKKLYIRNISVETSDPIFSFFYSTHPSLKERLNCLVR